MAHLICYAHSKRSIVLPTKKIVHRENGKECLSFTLSFDGQLFTPKQVVEFGALSMGNPATGLLKEIFEGEKS